MNANRSGHSNSSRLQDWNANRSGRSINLMITGVGIQTGKDPKGVLGVSQHPKGYKKGSLRTQNLLSYSNYVMLNQRTKISPESMDLAQPAQI